MKPTQLIVASILATVCTPMVRADAIPMPDGIVYGYAYIDDAPVLAVSDVTIVARVHGMEAPIAFYHMGTVPTAKNCYVLHFPHAVQDDGKTPNPDSARSGKLATIYVKQGLGPEEYIADVAIPASGDVVKLNLPSDAEDFSLPAPLDLPPVGSDKPSLPDGLCGQGVAPCGAMGLLNLCLMFFGLGRMKKRYGRRRQDQS